MSILSSIKGALSRGRAAISSLTGGASQSAGALNYNNPANNNLQAARSANQSIAPNMSTAYGPAYTDANGRVVVVSPNGQANPLASLGAGSSQLPPPPRGSSIPSFTAGTNFTMPSGSPTVESSPVTISPRITADTMNTASASLASVPSGSTGGGSSSISMPSAPSYSNPGQVNLAGTASSLSGMYALNPTTGQLEPVTQDTLAAERKKTQASLQALIPQKDNILQTPEVAAQEAEVKRRQEEVTNYTAQLNSIVAKQNADLLQVRGVDSKEGVTQAVYGGQETEINREAAIKALPVQAQVAAAQGNLQLAQDYLTNVIKLKTEQVDNEYTYKSALYNSTADFAKGEDKIKLDALIKQNDRTYQESKDNLSRQDAWAKLALENAPSLVSAIHALNPASPTFNTDLNRITAGMNKAGVGTASSFIDIIQQAIDAGATPEQAAREAATVSENSGISVDQKTLSSWVTQAKDLKKTPPATTQTTGVAGADTSAKIESAIQSIHQSNPETLSGLNANSKMRDLLKLQGFTTKEIADSSAGSTVDSLIASVNSFLFGQ